MPPPDDQRVFLSGTIDVPQDQLQAVSAALEQHILLTRAEPGCLSFDVVPDPQNSSRFHLSEVFEDQQAFEFHQSRAQATDWPNVSRDCTRNFHIATGMPPSV